MNHLDRKQRRIYSSWPPPTTCFLEYTHVWFSDPDGQPKLSPEQTSVSAVWKRPNLPSCDGRQVRILPEDILQHVVTDCSVCASVSVCLEHSRRFSTHVRYSYCSAPCIIAHGRFRLPRFPSIITAIHGKAVNPSVRTIMGDLTSSFYLTAPGEGSVGKLLLSATHN